MDDVTALRTLARVSRQPGQPLWRNELAAWLDYCATDLEDASGDPNGCDSPEEIRSAVRVARAYCAEAAS